MGPSSLHRLCTWPTVLWSSPSVSSTPHNFLVLFQTLACKAKSKDLRNHIVPASFLGSFACSRTLSQLCVGEKKALSPHKQQLEVITHDQICVGLLLCITYAHNMCARERFKGAQDLVGEASSVRHGLRWRDRFELPARQVGGQRPINTIFKLPKYPTLDSTSDSSKRHMCPVVGRRLKSCPVNLDND